MYSQNNVTVAVVRIEVAAKNVCRTYSEFRLRFEVKGRKNQLNSQPRVMVGYGNGMRERIISSKICHFPPIPESLKTFLRLVAYKFQMRQNGFQSPHGVTRDTIC